jgi:hydrogenase maturation protein HypF
MVSVGSAADDVIRRRVVIGGVVQGVGFRPYLYRLADELRLNGFVRNNTSGVELEIQGHAAQVHRFLDRLPDEAPPMSRIVDQQVSPLEPQKAEQGFAIIASNAAGQRRVAVTPDAHVCDDCLRELADTTDRRYQYPFINCTNCGPRFTITRTVPYDRPNTTMACFALCDDCRREYENPLDRRFHAQPVACPACGPRLLLVQPSGERVLADDPVATVRQLLLEGAIVAIKGVGGFHLACNAFDEQAVAKLRQRKGRETKPFAVMVRDLTQGERLACLSQEERRLLATVARPIVLVQGQSGQLAPSVAPHLDHVGLMLPYSPLHHLLLQPPMPPLVMTSGNPSEEPITSDNDEAVRRLGPLCDLLLLHDREICSACDDSVAHVIHGNPQLLRRSRGYVPRPFSPQRLPVPGGILALGGEMKAAICLTRPGQLIVGRHLGELTNVATQELLRHEVEHLAKLLGVEWHQVVHDQHPDYFSTKLARELVGDRPALAIQHHHAHLASCLAENDVAPEEQVLGVIYDGTGYGTDGTIWGGEFLLGSYGQVRRVAHLRPLPLPGGDAAVRRPYRTALACLYESFGAKDLPTDVACLQGKPQELNNLVRMLDAGLNCPLSSGMGRLFDAVAALIGLPGGLADPIGHEAQAAQELEAAAGRATVGLDHVEPYPYELDEGGQAIALDYRPLIRAVTAGSLRGEKPEVVALRFHATLVEATDLIAHTIAEREGVGQIALSGGCFHNRLLAEQAVRRLERRGYIVFHQQRVPCGDGGLALGQAAIACVRQPQ